MLCFIFTLHQQLGINMENTQSEDIGTKIFVLTALF